MVIHFKDRLVIGISSRALFDLDKIHQIFETKGLERYQIHQIEHELDVLEPGPAFPLVEKLLALKHPETDDPLVEIILLSRNSADSGLRIFNSIQHYRLAISRAAFTNGQSPYQYLNAFQAQLFLSANTADVENALNEHCAAATLLSAAQGGNKKNTGSQQVRIAFDGDAVLFSDEAEKIYQAEGLKTFQAHEKEHAQTPLSGGPFKGFLHALQQLQSLFSAEACPIRTALITARNAPAHERVVRTLRDWNIRIDEALFLGGLNKSEFLKAFDADIFFDDQQKHCKSASQHVATGHVPHGMTNLSQNS